MDTKELERQIRDVYTTLMYAFSKLKKRIKRLEDNGTGGGGFDLLWTNPTPNSNFNPQDVAIENLSDYRLILITYHVYRAEPPSRSVIAALDEAPWLQYAKVTSEGVSLRSRDCQIHASDGYLHFGNCKIGTTSETNNNGYNVPLYIYGIK